MSRPQFDKKTVEGLIAQLKNAVSKKGYRDDSPFNNAQSLLIQGPYISMSKVSKPILAAGMLKNKPVTKLITLLPGKEYNFQGADSVQEYKIFKGGGRIDADYQWIDGESILFLGNQHSSMDVKFNRVASIAYRYQRIQDKLSSIIEKEAGTMPTSKEYNLAVASRILLATGIRIGNEDSSEGFFSEYKEKGKKVFAKTYGLTTLTADHISTTAGVVSFDFTGKKHVENTYTLNKSLSGLTAPIIASKHTPLFGIDEPELTSFIKNKLGKNYSSKDFRTFRANVYAYQVASKLPAPTSKKEKREHIRTVAEHVSKLLNNTPQVTRSSYMDKRLFDYLWPDTQVEKAQKLQKEKDKKIDKKRQGGLLRWRVKPTDADRLDGM